MGFTDALKRSLGFEEVTEMGDFSMLLTFIQILRVVWRPFPDIIYIPVFLSQTIPPYPLLRKGMEGIIMVCLGYYPKTP